MKNLTKLALSITTVFYSFQGCSRKKAKSAKVQQPTTCEHVVTATENTSDIFKVEIKRRGKEGTAYEISSAQCGSRSDGTPDVVAVGERNPFDGDIHAAFLTTVDPKEADTCPKIFDRVLERINSYGPARQWNTAKPFTNMDEVVNVVCIRITQDTPRTPSTRPISEGEANILRDQGASRSDGSPGSVNSRNAAAGSGPAPLPTVAIIGNLEGASGNQPQTRTETSGSEPNTGSATQQGGGSTGRLPRAIVVPVDQTSRAAGMNALSGAEQLAATLNAAADANVSPHMQTTQT